MNAAQVVELIAERAKWHGEHCGYCGRAYADMGRLGNCEHVTMLIAQLWGTDEERAKLIAPQLRFWIIPEQDYQI